MNEATPLGLVGMNEYLRTRISSHPDKSQLAAEVGIKYQRLLFFAKNAGSTLMSDDLERLMTFYGINVQIELPTMPQPVTGWVVHPDNSAYEYEIDIDRKPTGKVRKIVAPKAAAE